VKRPSFQFYPADWRNNAKLRRCSWAARGVWIELMGLMHDSDEYGLLRWPLKQIAQALGCPVKLLNELVECGVLYGCSSGECEPLIYTPRSGRKDGEPVVLVPVQAGPVWYSPRMVRDEYVRTIRGEGTRFGDGEKPSPKGGIGDGNGAAPSQRKGDGATSSSSSSSSTPVPNGTSVDARRRFEMFEGWQPDEMNLAAQLRMQGVARSAVSEGAVAEFVAYWSTKALADSQGGWCHQLVKRAKAMAVAAAAKPAPAEPAPPADTAPRKVRL
jgi:hypothetical protein